MKAELSEELGGSHFESDVEIMEQVLGKPWATRNDFLPPKIGASVSSGAYDSTLMINENEELIATLQANQSPELHGKIEDFRIHTIAVFDLLDKLGLINGVDIIKVQQKVHKKPVYLFPGGQRHVYEGGFYEFNRNGENGFIGFGNRGSGTLTLHNFMHEQTHSALQSFLSLKPGSGIPLGLMEATVDHIADRGLQLFDQDRKSAREMAERFNLPKIDNEDYQDGYCMDRRLLYALCVDGITVQDFVRSIVSDDTEDTNSLIEKINLEFMDLVWPHEGHTDVLFWINERIDGKNAVELTGGLKNRQARVLDTIAMIQDLKGKHSLAKATRARIHLLKEAERQRDILVMRYRYRNAITGR